MYCMKIIKRILNIKNMNNTIELANKIRKHTLAMIRIGKSSHVGSNLSMADIIAVLYGHIMKFDIFNPEWEMRDRFVVSKGHAAASLYAVLAECGFFNLLKLNTYYQDGSDLCGHVTKKNNPGIEFSTGSLGHGLPVAVGIAKSAQIKKAAHRIFCLLSDGECDEGSNWEAILFASHHKLSNLCVLVDRNGLQSIKSTEETLKLEPIDEKFKAFGWDVSLIDGHCHNKILSEISTKKSAEYKPKAIICNTVKGKGISFMENQIEWHYKYPNMPQYLEALQELNSKQ